MSTLEHLAAAWKEKQKEKIEQVATGLGTGIEPRIISSLAHNPKEAYEFLANVPPNLFENPVHKKIYAVMLKLSMFYGEITITILSQFLDETECGIAMQIVNREPLLSTDELISTAKEKFNKIAKNYQPTPEEIAKIFSKK